MDIGSVASLGIFPSNEKQNTPSIESYPFLYFHVWNRKIGKPLYNKKQAILFK